MRRADSPSPDGSRCHVAPADRRRGAAPRRPAPANQRGGHVRKHPQPPWRYRLAAGRPAHRKRRGSGAGSEGPPRRGAHLQRRGRTRRARCGDRGMRRHGDLLPLKRARVPGGQHLLRFAEGHRGGEAMAQTSWRGHAPGRSPRRRRADRARPHGRPPRRRPCQRTYAGRGPR